jgi:hypothetical protein
MFDHRVVPVDEGSKPIAFPEQISRLAFFRLLQDKAEPGVVAFVLDAGEPTPATLEAHPFRRSHTDPIEGAIGARGERLCQDRIEMVSNPAAIRFFGRGLERIVGEATLLAQASEGSAAFLFLGAGDGSGLLPGRVSPHLAQASEALGQHGIVELAARFQVRTQAFGLSFLHL